MTILRVVLWLTCFLSAQPSYAVEIPRHCNAIYLSNNSEQAFEVSGNYPDSQDKLKTILLAPYTAQQSISLETVKTCSGNTKKIHCNAMWVICHKNINIVIKNANTEDILLSEVIHENDSVSINQCTTCDKPSIVLINEALL